MSSEPLPPSVSHLLSNRSKVFGRFSLQNQMAWRHSLLRVPIYRRPFPFTSSSFLPDTPSASFYRLYQLFVVDWTIQFRNELEYFWNRASWALADLPDPGLGDDGLPESEAKLRKAVMAGLTRIMKLAYNRLISKGLPRNAPAVVMDWAKEMERLDPVVELPNAKGELLGVDEPGDEEFAVYEIKVATPHWVFV